jgi:hypothetical protein
MSRLAYGGLLFAVVLVGLGVGWVFSSSPQVSFGHASAATSPGRLPSPITPASDGKLQCYGPNPDTKSCKALAGYEVATGGGIVNPMTTLLSTGPRIIMRDVTPVTIKSNQVCAVARREDFEAATFEIQDEPATAAQSAMLKRKIETVEKRFFGHEICVAYITVGDEVVAESSVDGVFQPAMNQKVMWVSPEDGYQVQF